MAALAQPAPVETPPGKSREAAPGWAQAWLVLFLVAAYIALGLAYARVTPAWQAPDEPAHFNYVGYVAARGELPVLTQGDYPANVVPLAPSARPSDVSAFRYESHQPPLFYLLGALVYEAHPSLFALRTLSVLFGAGLVPLAFLCARLVLPGEPWLAFGAAAFAGFIPMHLFVAGSVNNDTLADLVLSLLLTACLAIVVGSRGRWQWWVLGLLFGLALITKLTIYVPAALLVGLALLSLARDRTAVAQAAGTVVGVAAMVSGWWFIRNGLTYGWGDMLAQSRQADVAGGQTHTGVFGAGQLGNWIAGSFHSFWGQFGWMSVPLGQREYVLVMAFTGVVLAGWMRIALGRYAATASSGDSSLDAQNDKRALAWLALGLTWLGTTASYFYYNLTFLQTQGRYLFPALIPIGIFCVAGFAALFPRRAQPPAIMALGLMIMAFSVYTLQHDLAPAFR